MDYITYLVQSRSHSIRRAASPKRSPFSPRPSIWASPSWSPLRSPWRPPSCLPGKPASSTSTGLCCWRATDLAGSSTRARSSLRRRRLCGDRRPAALDHDDFGLNQSKIMNVIDSKNLERDGQISLRNLRKLDCAGKPVPTFPHPALSQHGRIGGVAPPLRRCVERQSEADARQRGHRKIGALTIKCREPAASHRGERHRQSHGRG
jgi:hypothetical protein